MTCGIYSLNFVGTPRVYIGQSINIEKRYREHMCSLRAGKASKKLQEAYNTYGIPSVNILEIGLKQDLDTIESRLISEYSGYTEGFNTMEESYGAGPSLFGEDNPKCKSSNASIEETFFLIINSLDLNLIQISEKTGVSISVVRAISAGTRHIWLKDKYPKEWETLTSNKARREVIRSKCTIRYIKSPEGIVYEITNVSKFAKEHNLGRPHLSSVLVGSRKAHKGWTLP